MSFQTADFDLTAIRILNIYIRTSGLSLVFNAKISDYQDFHNKECPFTCQNFPNILLRKQKTHNFSDLNISFTFIGAPAHSVGVNPVNLTQNQSIDAQILSKKFYELQI